MTFNEEPLLVRGSFRICGAQEELREHTQDRPPATCVRVMVPSSRFRLCDISRYSDHLLRSLLLSWALLDSTSGHPPRPPSCLPPGSTCVLRGWTTSVGISGPILRLSGNLSLEHLVCSVSSFYLLWALKVIVR